MIFSGGRVHPKVKILSSFTHPHVVPTYLSFFMWNTKEDILKNVGCQTISVPIDFHCMLKSTMEFLTELPLQGV